MFCPECGSEISNESKYCTSCGQPVRLDPQSAKSAKGESSSESPNNHEPSDSSKDYSDKTKDIIDTLPSHIRDNLKHYDKHHENMTCLECGYKGMMGVKRIETPPIASMWVIIPSVMVLSFLLHAATGAGLIAAIVLGVIGALLNSAASTTVLDCPNCNEELAPKK